jgi:hypothetical protein
MEGYEEEEDGEGRILRAPAGLGVGGGEKLDAQSIPCAEA